MLFSEFMAGTGCKDNEHNHKVYRDLEVMYMNSDLSKNEIYEYGKKLVDNSKTPEQLELESRIEEEIQDLKDEIKLCKKQAEFYKYIGDRDMIRYYDKLARRCRNRIRELKWVLL